MKIITNTSLQSWSLFFQTGKGVQSYYLEPNQTIKVPSSYITDHVLRYQERNLIAIRNA
jgi:hypothetical protein